MPLERFCIIIACDYYSFEYKNVLANFFFIEKKCKKNQQGAGIPM